jgi:hypothetical protein
MSVDGEKLGQANARVWGPSVEHEVLVGDATVAYVRLRPFLVARAYTVAATEAEDLYGSIGVTKK